MPGKVVTVDRNTGLPCSWGQSQVDSRLLASAWASPGLHGHWGLSHGWKISVSSFLTLPLKYKPNLKKKLLPSRDGVNPNILQKKVAFLPMMSMCVWKRYEL